MTQYRNQWQKLLIHPVFPKIREFSGAIILFSVLLLSSMAPVLTHYDPVTANMDEIYESPSTTHPCGTDGLGRDVFSRLLYGTRLTILIGITASLLAAILGVTVGLLAGYYRGIWDSILMRTVDMWYAVPEMMAILFILTLYPRSIPLIILAIAIPHWATPARLVRSEALSLRQRPFIETSIGLGAGNLYVLLRHMFPNILHIAIVTTTLMTSHAIMHEAALGFLGLGVPVHEPSWGNMLSEARIDILLGVWWTSFFPGIFIVITVLSVYQIGTALSERFVPRRELRAE
ncbi:MAG: ABC transporter permease [Methanosarcinaceae archaeon]|nr:ABC transporter permease [Methanosarcinaceae archaeon]MDD4497753.1 ABC transporter permease [Methanosarcinaceae archaeon]